MAEIKDICSKERLVPLDYEANCDALIGLKRGEHNDAFNRLT